MADVKLGVGDFVLLDSVPNQYGDTSITTQILRKFTAEEVIFYSGESAGIEFTDAWWGLGNTIVLAERVLAVCKANWAAAEDLGPLVSPPLNNPNV